MRILYDPTTGQTFPDPRTDGGMIIGLVPPLVVLEVIQQPPPPHDPATQRLEPDAGTVDLMASTMTRGWLVVTLPPASDWMGFASWLYVFPPIAAAMEAARLSTDPQGEPATTGLPAALQEARLNENYPAWAATWGQFLLASQMPPEALAEIIAKAMACNLPADFIAALQPQLPGGEG